MQEIYRTIARILPSTLRKRIENLLSFSTIRIEPQSFIGFVTITTVLLGLLVGFIFSLLLKINFVWNYSCAECGYLSLDYRNGRQKSKASGRIPS